VRRFSETRPCSPPGGKDAARRGIREERQELAPLRALADEIVDTTQMRIRDLRERMIALGREARPAGDLAVTVLSFGYKFGVPTDTDLVFDVRFIRNPFFEEGLKHQTGLDDSVRDYVLGRPETASFSRSFSVPEVPVPLYAPMGEPTSPLPSAAPEGNTVRLSSPGRSPKCSRATVTGPSAQPRHPGGLAPEGYDHDRFVLATHGDLGQSLIGAMEMIVVSSARWRRSRSRLRTVSRTPRRGLTAPSRRTDTGEGVLMLTDMLGGTPSNLCLSLLGTNARSR